MDAFISAVRWTSRIFGVLAVILLVLAVLAVCHLVVVRYILNGSAIWQHEFVTFAIIGSTLLGSPYVLLTRGHVNVDLLPQYLGPKGRMALALLASGVSFLFCATVAYVGFSIWHEAWVNDWRNETVWAPPLWIPYGFIPVGLTLVCLQYLADVLSLLTGRDMPFGLPPKEEG
jgi:TRAP-type C4-dicarboxylate transport system permease small subunit